MLNDKDVELIKATRRQITQHRLKPFTLLLPEAEPYEDPYTGNIVTADAKVEVVGTWTPVTGTAIDIKYVDGVQIVTGDITADLDLGYDYLYDMNKVTHIERDGIRYVVRAIERIGLGEDNRFFILMRRVY